MLALKLTRRYQRSQFYDLRVQTGLEAHITAQMRSSAGKLRAVQEGQKRSADYAAVGA